MGREIRRVPPNWQHPLLDDQRRYATPNSWDWTGQGRHFQPLFDEDYESALQSWWDERQLWKAGKHPDQQPYAYEQWAGRAPDPDCYRPAWTDAERTHFQVYETVSEGTPVSPVFASRAAIADWLVNERGYSHEAAEAFAQDGWAPSGATFQGQFYRDIEAAAIPKRES
jgi:hypothetical protein